MSRNTAPRYSVRNPGRARPPELPPSNFPFCFRQIAGNGFRSKVATDTDLIWAANRVRLRPTKWNRIGERRAVRLRGGSGSPPDSRALLNCDLIILHHMAIL